MGLGSSRQTYGNLRRSSRHRHFYFQMPAWCLAGEESSSLLLQDGRSEEGACQREFSACEWFCMTVCPGQPRLSLNSENSMYWP